MKWLFMLFLSFSLVGCDNKEEQETDKQQKEAHDARYKTPPPSDRSKDKGY
jgi:uncharacterized lipoprotein YehR (DUF1307 family)